MPYAVGEVAGFDEKEAARLVKIGAAVYAASFVERAKAAIGLKPKPGEEPAASVEGK